MKPVMTIEQARLFLSERGVYELYKRDIKIRGRWALVRTKYQGQPEWDDEIDCYDLKAQGLVAEAWDGIPYKDSPFIPNNEERTAKALETMTEEYLKRYPDPLTGLCLVAVSGDCSKHGMGGPNNVLPIKDEHEAIVREYLRATLEWRMDCSFSDQHDREDYLLDNYDKASHALLNAGVFHHKYHMRTTWELAYLGEVEELERFHPYKIVEVEA